MQTFYNFTGPFNINNWTLTPDGGVIKTGNAPYSITIVSSERTRAVTAATTVTIIILFDTVINFDWNSSTIDISYRWDPFGYLLNGVFTKLTSDGKNPESGAVNLSLRAGDSFGFCTKSTDSLAGPSTTIVSNFSYSDNYPCFNENTKILTDKGYKPIQDLRKGDLVKTLKHHYIPIDMIGKREIYHPALEERIKNQLYNCSQNEYDVFEDLIITGCHSILVDSFINDEQKERVIEVNGDTFVTNGKYRLPACADPRASVYETPGNYTIYHFALENDDYYNNYGVYANGILVESCSKLYLKELSNMTLI